MIINFTSTLNKLRGKIFTSIKKITIEDGLWCIFSTKDCERLTQALKKMKKNCIKWSRTERRKNQNREYLKKEKLRAISLILFIVVKCLNYMLIFTGVSWVLSRIYASKGFKKLNFYFFMKISFKIFKIKKFSNFLVSSKVWIKFFKILNFC